MKNTKKLRYGGVAVALTAIIIAVIVLFNVIFTALSSKYMWYIDMTANRIYSLTDQCLTVVRDGIAEINAKREAENEKNGLSPDDEGYADPARVNIYFCSDPDILMADEAQRYIYETVRELADKCDFINIEYLNWRYNPSTVAKYRSAGSSINAYSVIVDADNYYTEGNNWIAYSQPRFFASDTSGNTIGYNGERVIASAILSVCSADTPIAYVATNHSEAFYDDSLLDTLSYAGYKIVSCDISDRDFEFSDNGRLLVIYNPRSDASVEEIAKIDEFLERSNSMMVFMDPNSPVLPNLEEYLETWGIVFDRVKEDGKTYSTIVNDTSNSLSSDGYTVKGEYVKTNEGLASDIYKGMIENGYTPSVIFPDAMPIKIADSFSEKRFENEENPEYDYNYGYAELDGVERYVYDMFTAYDSATGIVNGAEVEKTYDYKLMTMSVRKNTLGDSTGQTDPKNSYVLCAGSTKFAAEKYLESAVYGNSDVLLSATATIGRDIIPAVGVDFKYFQSYDMSTITDAEANEYTLWLSVLPPVIVFAAGAFVLIRRKYS
ncbi:MAG: hypothetical protein E7640_00540 [Ruminococcaceae bacterium]|nr:hypothetical protein [Oscillospiraceae bacterium]